MSPHEEDEKKADAGPGQDAYLTQLESHTGEVNAFGQRKDERLQPQLLPRHLAMISIGGVIGTGLFLGTGTTLERSGPVALWLGYIVVGTLCFGVMRCLEMVAYLPQPGGLITMAERFVHPALASAVGWLYWYNWLMSLPAELSAAAVLVSFWSDLSPAIWISVFLFLVVVINFLGARAYGEVEFWACSIKIITIMGLLVLSIALVAGAGKQGTLGFRYWRDPGAFVQFEGIRGALGRFLAFYDVFSRAVFSYLGTEIVAMAAGEAKNPRRAVPKAIRSVWIRILFFYVLGTLFIGLICPSNAPELTTGAKTAARSPFVIAIKHAGIRGLPSVINVALITSAVSAASSDLYTSSRALYSLALSNQAPRVFARTTRNGVPVPALVVSVAFALLSYLSVGSSARRVFDWFVNMCSVSGLAAWCVIGFTAIRFYKGLAAQGIDKRTMPLQGWLQPYLAYYTFGLSLLVVITHGFHLFLKDQFKAADFITEYLPIPLFLVLLLAGWLRSGREPIVAPENMDFVTGLRELVEAEVEDDEPKKWLDKAFHILA